MSYVTWTRSIESAASAPEERNVGTRHGGRLMATGLAAMVLLSQLTACSLDGLLKSDQLPPDVTNPALTETPAGARAAYLGALAGFQRAFGASAGPSFVLTTGLLSDELVRGNGFGFGFGFGFAYVDTVDLRRLDESPRPHVLFNALLTNPAFQNLNNARQQARQAIGLLHDYVPEEPALRAHLYAVEGYTEVMLAELYCSGIPLSTVDYKGDYTLRPGSSTAEVLTHATALFDTALALAGATDSTRIMNMSRLGRGRALLGLGDYVGASLAVASVPDAFRYTLRYGPSASADSAEGIGFYSSGLNQGIWTDAGVAESEGANGLPYRSSGDPRTSSTLLGNGRYHPTKYQITGADTILLASGIEARLIAAEAALQAGDGSWLTTLNQLRQTAIAPALADTTDPGSDTARVSLLFRERAFWLFLTGHRQGDMRRLVRQYQRPQEQVYPVGAGTFGGTYGQHIDAPIPWSERELNPLFTGCRSRD